MSIVNAVTPRFYVRDIRGNALVGAKVYVYEAGTSTLLTTWTDYTKTTENANPVITDSTGAVDIWFEEAAKFDVKTSDDVQVSGYPVDNVQPQLASTITGNHNLLQNGDFEVDSNSDGVPDNWTVTEETNATIAIDSTSGGQISGVNGLKFTANGDGGGTATSDIFDVPTSAIINVIFYFKQADAATGTYSVDLYWYQYDGAASAVSASTNVWSSTSGATTTFTKYSRGVTAPSDATQAKLVLTGLANGGSDESGSCWYDFVNVFNTFGYYFDSNGDKVIGGNVNITGTLDVGSSTPIDSILDEDTMTSDSATALATQQSIKAYVDTKIASLNTKIVEIGDWNMDSSVSGSVGAQVAHGLTLSKIRTIFVLIRNDADTQYWDLKFDTTAETSSHGFYVDSTYVWMTHGGVDSQFDTTNFDSTSYNRGWVIIQYTD